MANLIVAEAAEAECAAAADWYAEGSLAAADGFTEAIAAAFRRILDRPEWGAACDDAHSLEVVWPSEAECQTALEQFSELHLSHGLGLLDALIAATAVGHAS